MAQFEYEYAGYWRQVLILEVIRIFRYGTFQVFRYWPAVNGSDCCALTFSCFQVYGWIAVVAATEPGLGAAFREVGRPWITIRKPLGPLDSGDSRTRDTAQGHLLQDGHTSNDFRWWRVAVIWVVEVAVIWVVEGCGHLGGGGCAIPGPNCRIRPGKPVGHPPSPPVTTSMLHRCRDNGINVPLMSYSTVVQDSGSDERGRHQWYQRHRVHQRHRLFRTKGVPLRRESRSP
jgi:hypothetical protein